MLFEDYLLKVGNIEIRIIINNDINLDVSSSSYTYFMLISELNNFWSVSYFKWMINNTLEMKVVSICFVHI